MSLPSNPPDSGVGDGGGGAGTGGTGASATSSTVSSPAAVASPGGAGGGSYDIPLRGAGLGPPVIPVNAPARPFAQDTPVLVAPNPNNAGDFYFSLAGPQDVIAAGNRRVVKAATNPFTVYVRNLAQIWGAGAVTDQLILTVQPR